MTLPTPDLDDRHFQELVDDAKRLVMARCPEWTDHNVSDPGVTLIEAFAHMTDVLLYRLNRVPDRLYVKFLEMIGVQRFGPAAARCGVTFSLSTPATALVTVPRGTRVATVRNETEEPIVFSTSADLGIMPCTSVSVATVGADGGVVDVTDLLRVGKPIPAFSDPPCPGDALLFGLSDAIPGCALRLQLNCSVSGVGVDPDDAPLRWEAFDGTSWQPCEVGKDGTGGLNAEGAVILHVPPSHAPIVDDGRRRGLVRVRLAAPRDDQRTYSSSPLIHAVVADTVGGTVDSTHADIIELEVLGIAEGTAAQRFRTAYAPVLPAGGNVLVRTTSGDVVCDWSPVEHFAASGPDDRHFTLDPVTGEIAFGPVIRQEDGSLRQHGAVPPQGAVVAIEAYATGGGRHGNVAAGAIRTLKSSMPFVAAVENRHAAAGGVDGESIEGAKSRGPIALRTRNRAVTAEDFEQIVRATAPEIARVRCLPASDAVEAGSVRVLIVPAAPIVDGRIAFGDLVPSEEVMARLHAALDTTRLIGTRVIIEPPTYQGVTVVAQVKAEPRTSATRIREEATATLHRYFNPLVGGPDGHGWPWGRPIQSGEAYAALQEIRGVDFVEEIRVYGANPVTGERGPAATRLELAPSAIAFSYEHQIRVVEP